LSVSYEVQYIEGEPEDVDEPTFSKDDSDEFSSQEDNSLKNKKSAISSNQHSKKDLIEYLSTDNMMFDENSTMTNEALNINSINLGSKKQRQNEMNNDNEDDLIDTIEKSTDVRRNKSYDYLSNDDETSNLETNTNFKNRFVKEVIGDLSSSDDEIGEDEYQDEGIEQKASQFDNNESNSNMESVLSNAKSKLLEGPDENQENDNDIMSYDDNSNNNLEEATYSNQDRKNELIDKLNKLLGEIQIIQEGGERREIEINPINNPVLKAHLSSRLNNLIEDENKKKKEIEQTQNLLAIN